MKIRLYRGPHANKTMVVPDDFTCIVMASTKTRDLFWDSNRVPAETVTPRRETYSMRMMAVTLNGRAYRAPAMHPDGSVYFEWDKPRRK